LKYLTLDKFIGRNFELLKSVNSWQMNLLHGLTAQKCLAVLPNKGRMNKKIKIKKFRKN
jgi:hypothetical protein